MFILTYLTRKCLNSTAFRGFKVRQKYGPLINKKTGKIDAETFTFIKCFAKRWKEKTIFQVLLHYRAARYQDLVNISQQIHLYNQRMVAALKLTNSCLLLEKIDPKESNPALLGPTPLSVRKLPFCLDDIPYFDTTYLCDPVVHSYLNSSNIAFGDVDSDQEPWDAPLQRNSGKISTKITVSTQMPYNRYSQTEIAGIDNEFSNINEMYSRDPNVQFNPIVKRRESKGPSLQLPEPKHEKALSSCTELQPLSEPPVTTNYVVPKKPQQVPEPSGTARRHNSYGKKKPAPMVPVVACSSKAEANNVTQVSALNPVKEMQLIGKQQGNESEEEPPFNFQGMLRKTKYNRASMKRSGSNEMANFANSYFNGGKTNESNNNHGQQKPNNVVYLKENKMDETTSSLVPGSRPQSSLSTSGYDDNENAMTAMATPIPIERKMALPTWIDKDDSHDHIDVHEDIHPSVIFEGYGVEI